MESVPQSPREFVNRIEAIQATTRYVSEPHMVLSLDGVPLDAIVDQARPDLHLLGLVPTLLDWLDDPNERELVWSRILPPVGGSATAPVLMCPDDLDLWCTLIVADVVSQKSAISWRRLGLDRSKSDSALRLIGVDVEWIDALGPFVFDRVEYERCMVAFKRPQT